MTDVPGWYGKLPALGDFASRRLTPEWIAQWDAWLAEGLHLLREAAPDSWLDDYLARPGALRCCRAACLMAAAKACGWA